MAGLGDGTGICPGVVPVLVGPLQVLLTILPGLLLALAGGVFGLLKPSGFKSAVVLLWRQKLAVASLAVLGVGVYFGLQHVWPSAPAGVIGTAQGGEDWPTARGDLRRRGTAPGSRSPVRPRLVWAYRNGAEGYLASPAVAGNRVYIASAQIGVFSKSGSIHCLDADTGTLVWASAPENYRPTFSSPVIAGDYLVCGEGLHDTRDARVVCLDRNKGAVLWTFRTNNHVECTPVVADGRVYVGAGDDGYYCLDLKPGPDGQAKVLWHLPTEKYPDAETSLAVFEGKVYAGLGNAGAALVVLDAATGAELHRLEMPYPVFSPPSIADGRIYLGMGNGDYVKSGEGGEVRCLDLKSLKTLWTFPLPQTVLGAVSIAEDKLYFGCSDQHVYCLSKQGKLLAKRDLFAPIKTSLAVTDEHVFAVNETGLLFGLDRNTLAPVWEYRLGTEGMFISSPVVARGHVYVGTQQEGLLCIGKPPSSKQTPHWLAPLGGPGLAGNCDSSPIPAAGELHWLYADTKGVRPETTAPAPPPALCDEHLYVVRTESPKGLECLALQKEDRQPPQTVWRSSVDDAIHESPVILGRIVACVPGKPGAHRKLLVLDRHTGASIAEHPIAAKATGILTATLHQFLIQDGPEQLTSLDTDGKRQWTVTLGKLVCPPVANDSMIIAPVAQEVLALDRETGARLWSAPVADGPARTPILDKRTFLLPTTKGLELRDLLNGAVLDSWTEKCSGELAAAAGLAVFISSAGELVVFDPAAGKAKMRVPNARRGQTPLVSRDRILYQSAVGSLMTVKIGNDEPAPELWLEPILDSRKEPVLPGPLLLKDSRIFTMLPGRGLACLGAAP